MAKTPTTARTGALSRRRDPFQALRERVDSLFDDFAGGFWGRGSLDLEPFRGFGASFPASAPSVNLAETEKAYEIAAELPGMDEKDVEVELANGVLTIKGEKKEETEDKDEKKNFYLVERSYGSFQRAFRLPENVSEDKISADFAKGVLRITLPKKEPTKVSDEARRISIKAG